MEHKNNILTYLKWRGDLTVAQAPFNEVDALILAELSYVSFDGIVPGVGEKAFITIEDATKAFMEQNSEESLEAAESLISEAPFLLMEMAKTKRFSQMKLCNYVNQVDYERVEQFSAVHIQMSPWTTFIAFRGTDDELVGWKENFNMSYMMPVPAQKSAQDYMDQTATGWFKKFWVGGHSKGGNLAIYASTFCKASIQRKIVHVYSFDGPGFNQKMVDNQAYIKIQNLISAYVPQSSVVGMLLEHQEDYEVIKSAELGIMQHDGMSWEIEGARLIREEDRDESSYFMDETITSWLEKIDDAQRERFVDALFGMFEQAGIHYLSDLRKINMKRMVEMITAISSISQEEREIILKIFYMLFEEAEHTRKKEKNIIKRLFNIEN